MYFFENVIILNLIE